MTVRLFMLTLMILVGLFATGTAPKTDQKQWLSYQPAVVELTGRLVVKTYYGPPNYGENPKTDAKEAQPVLTLETPVNVLGNPQSDDVFDRVSVEDVRELQLLLAMPHKQFIGKKVTFKGTLFHAATGHHHTDVLMDVRSIKLAL